MNTDRFIFENLLGGVWHVTNLPRFKMIKKDGMIKPEPDLADSDRWSTIKGVDWYPFVRSIGGFSLFDFPAQFDLDSYRLRCPSSMLEAFIPYPKKWSHGVWLKIDDTTRPESFLDGETVWRRSENEGHGKRCMPHIEAAHIGDMPITSVLNAYLISGDDLNWHSIE